MNDAEKLALELFLAQLSDEQARWFYRSLKVDDPRKKSVADVMSSRRIDD